MREAESRHPRVVNTSAHELSYLEKLSQVPPVIEPLREHDDIRALEPGVDLRERSPDLSRRIEDPRMRCDSKKFVDAWPRERPGVGALCNEANGLCRR